MEYVITTVEGEVVLAPQGCLSGFGNGFDYSGQLPEEFLGNSGVFAFAIGPLDLELACGPCSMFSFVILLSKITGERG